MMDFTVCVHIYGQGGERAKEGERPLGPCPTHSSLGTLDAPLMTRCPQWPTHLVGIYECSYLELRPCHLLYLSRTCEEKGVCHIKCPAIPEDECTREGKRETARVPSGHWPSPWRGRAEALEAHQVWARVVQGGGTDPQGARGQTS